jgi:type VI secretion system protein VasG
LALAELLYGGEQNLTTLNMSEFKEEHKVSLLMGSPPGYIGYGEGGVLTEAVRRRPYSVILLDEMEKAHPGVQDVFYQVFDKGTMKDGEGRDIDFRNTVIIMTSNAGAGRIAGLFADPETAPDAQGLAAAIWPELDKHFKPAFLGRVTLVPYVPLAPETMRSIARLQLARIARRVEQTCGASFAVGPGVEDCILAHAGDDSAGARGIESMLGATLLPDLSAQVLAHLSAKTPVEHVLVGADEAGVLRCTLHPKTSQSINEREYGDASLHEV